MSKKAKQLGAPRLRPQFAKEQKTFYVWPDHLSALRALGNGNPSAGIALLVAKHLKQPSPPRRAA